MITDALIRAAIYRAALPQLSRCFDYLTQLSVDTPTGRTDLDGERIFALVQRYRTKEAAARRYEAHDRHIDLHYLLDGSESLQVVATALLQPTEPTNREKDYTLYAERTAAHCVQLNPGDFALLFPHEGHKAGCIADVAKDVTKVVIKIRLAD